jgi:hypothetical protein
MITDRILATASVEKIEFGPKPLWEVVVTGLAPFDRTRTYNIRAKTDNLAAMEGINLFEEEMECLRNTEIEDK